MESNNAILITIILIFSLLGFFMPFINSEFGGTIISDQNNLKSSVEGSTPNYNLSTNEYENAKLTNVGFWDIFVSILGMFTWSFGILPLIIELIMMPFRIILYVIIYDKIRGI